MSANLEERIEDLNVESIEEHDAEEEREAEREAEIERDAELKEENKEENKWIDVYVNIPMRFAVKAHHFGAIWDDEQIAWKVTSKSMYDSLFKYMSNEDDDECHIREENRTNMKRRIPIGNYYSNGLHRLIDNRKRNFIYYRSGCKCEACDNDLIEPSEVYIRPLTKYDAKDCYYKLKYYIALCEKCANTADFTLSDAGNESFIRRVTKINKITQEEAYMKLVKACSIYINL